jgi:hypothetical protein
MHCNFRSRQKIQESLSSLASYSNELGDRKAMIERSRKRRLLKPEVEKLI